MKNIVKLIFVFIISASMYAQNKDIIILHVNDTHGRDAGEVSVTRTTPPTTNYFAGAARRAAYVNEVRKENKNALLLHAGDTITGSVFSTVFKGMDEVDIMNKMMFTAATIGNHEFDYGMENFEKVIKARKFPTVSANVKTKDGKAIVAPYITKTVDGVKIAIVGVTTSDAVYNPEFLQNIIIENEVKALKDLFTSVPLNTTNDITILLSHAGVDMDKKIASEMKDTFDIIVGGHSHTELKEPVKVGKTQIVQTGYYGQNVGRLDIKAQDAKTKNIKYTLVAMDAKVKEDPAMLKYVSGMQKKVSKEFDVKIGTLPMALEHVGIRSNSMALGNFASDLVLDSYPQADLVLMNSGSLRTPLPEGNITLGKIQNEFFPFDNQVVLVTVDGATIKEMLSISGAKRGAGAFLQVSREMEVAYDAKGKLISAKLKGKPIDNKADYVMALSSFVFEGGDGYVGKDGKALAKRGKNIVMTGNDMRDSMINNIKSHGNIPATYIDQKPRVTFK